MNAFKKGRVRPAQLIPLFRLAADAGEPPEDRLAALLAAAHFPLDVKGWQFVAEKTDLLSREGEMQPAMQAQFADVAARIPLRSWRKHLEILVRRIDASQRQPLVRRLAEQGDLSQIGLAVWLIDNADPGGYQLLAGLPLERVRTLRNLNRLKPPAEEGEQPSDAHFWYAVAVARRGNLFPLEHLLKQSTDRLPPLLGEDPWTTYAEIQTARPIPAFLHNRLKSLLDQPGDVELPETGRRIIWALTGLVDAEGTPFQTAQTGGDSFPQTKPSTAVQIDQARAAAARVRQGSWAELHQLGQQLAHLPAEESGPFVLETVKGAQERMSAGTEPGFIRNAIVQMSTGLQTGEWPVVALAELQLKSVRPVLSADQMAWLIARAGWEQLEPQLPELVQLNVDRRSLFDLVGRIADHLKKDSGPPLEGASPGTHSDRIPELELLDDEGSPLNWETTIIEISAEKGSPGTLSGLESLPAGGVNVHQEEIDLREVHAQIRVGGETRKTFLAGASNTIRCWISLPEEDRGARTGEAIPTTEIPAEGLLLTAQLIWRDQAVQSELVLPPDRTARTADCDLAINVPAAERFVSAEIVFRYRGAVFEAVRIEAEVLRAGAAEEDARFPLEITSILDRREVIKLQERVPVGTIILVGHPPGKGDGLPAGGKGSPIRVFNDQNAHYLDLKSRNTVIKNLNDQLFLSNTRLVRQQARDESSQTETLDIENAEVINLLKILARHGSALYNDLPDALKEADSERIQVFNWQADEYIPFEFIYDRGYPTEDAALCAAGFNALKNDEPACPECPSSRELTPLERMGVSKICPYGFWSLQKIIERHNTEDRSTHATDDRKTLEPLNDIVFASSHNVSEEDRAATWSALQTLFPAPKKADDWAQWLEILGSAVDEGQPLLLLLPHHLVRNAEDCLEIGSAATAEDRRLMARGRLQPPLVNPREVDPGPIVILMGCQTAADTETGYANLAYSFQKLPVSIVLGTLAKILGRHAAPVARELVTELVNAGETEADFGTVLRRVRRRMLARGYLMALCLVALGDAEWRLTPRS